MLARLPFNIAEEFDAPAVREQVERPVGTPILDLDGQGLLPPTQGGKSGTGQFSPASRSRLAAIPAVWRKGNLNKTLIDRQNWMAA